MRILYLGSKNSLSKAVSDLLVVSETVYRVQYAGYEFNPLE